MLKSKPTNCTSGPGVEGVWPCNHGNLRSDHLDGVDHDIVLATTTTGLPICLTCRPPVVKIPPEKHPGMDLETMICVCWHGDSLCVYVFQEKNDVACGFAQSLVCGGEEGGMGQTDASQSPPYPQIGAHLLVCSQGSGRDLGHVTHHLRHVTHYQWCSSASYPIPALGLA